MAGGRSARRRRPTGIRLEGERETRAITARIGSELRSGRRLKSLSQAELAALIGIHQTRVSQLELGFGASAPIGVWIAFGIAVDRPLAISATRTLAAPEPRDAGHLAIQELILGLAKANGIHGTFELPTRPAPSATYIDVGLRDDRRRTVAVIEIWNRFEDIGAGVRNFRRKLIEAEALAVIAGGDAGPYRICGCWVLRSTAANRALVARYPAIFAAEFPGSSRAWVRALTDGAVPHDQPGIVWADLAGTRLFELRLRVDP